MSQLDEITIIEARDLPLGALFGMGSTFYVLVKQGPPVALKLHEADAGGNLCEVSVNPAEMVFLHIGWQRSEHQRIFGEAWEKARAQKPELVVELQ